MLKVAIAGFGKMGQIRAEEIRKNSQTELVAIFDLNASCGERIGISIPGVNTPSAINSSNRAFAFASSYGRAFDFIYSIFFRYK